MSENLVIISEDNSESDFLFSCASYLKREKFNTFVSAANIKNYFSDNDYVCILIDSDKYEYKLFLRYIASIKKYSPNSRIIVISSSEDSDFINACIENGVYDFADKNTLPKIISTRVLNALRSLSAEKRLSILNIFLNSVNAINQKTGFYKIRVFSDVYDDLLKFRDIRNGTFIVLTINSASKTKVGMNRLAANIKKCIRQTDIAIQGLGKYYLLLPDTSVSGARIVTEKISSSMGDLKIHSGISKIGIKSFEELEKDLGNCLKSAIINDELCVTFEDENLLEDWDNVKQKDKHFKLFEKLYNKKLSELIEPLFFRFEKDFGYKLQGTEVSQYTDKIESVFCMKNTLGRSELIIHYDGFAKLNLKIKHQGLDTCENTDETITLNMLNEKLLSKYLKKLFNEFNSVK